MVLFTFSVPETTFLVKEVKPSVIIVSTTLGEQRLWNRQMSPTRLFHFGELSASVGTALKNLDNLKRKQTYYAWINFLLKK